MKRYLSDKKKLVITNNILLFLLILISVGIGISQIILKDNVKNTKKSTEEMWRKEASDKAKYLSEQLELSVSKDNLNYWDDEQLHQWAIEKLLPMKIGGETTNIILTNIGYSTRNWDEINWITTLEKLDIKLNVSDSQLINNTFKNMSVRGKSNIDIDTKITSFVESNKFTTKNLNKNNLLTAIQNVLFVKNKIIIDTNPSSVISNKFINTNFLEDYLVQDYSLFKTNYDKITSGKDSIFHTDTVININNKNKWIEWAVVPPNKLGWEFTSPTDNGLSNFGYKKLAIIVEIDRDDVLCNFDNNFVDKYILYSNIALLLTVLTGIVFIIVNFYNFLCRNK